MTSLLATIDLLLLGVVLILLGVTLIGWPRGEASVQQSVRAAPARLREAAADATVLGDPLVMLAGAVMLSAFGYHGSIFTRRQAIGIVAVALVALAATGVWKWLADRDRPGWGPSIDGSGFPSGHALAAAAVATVLARATLQAGYFKGTALIAAFAFIKLIVLTRVFIGAHYIEDVTTGAAVGIAIAVIVPRLLQLA